MTPPETGSAAVPRAGLHVIEETRKQQQLADALTDTELADALVAKVWAKFDVHSEESALLSAAIDRLRK